MTSRHASLTAHARPIARVWWLATRRLWRHSTILVPIWAVFVSVYSYHAAILALGTLTMLAALGLVAVLGGLHHGDAAEHVAPTAYLLWFMYAASLFLLCTIPGDWLSRHSPREVPLRSISQSDIGAGSWKWGVFWFTTFSGAIIVSAVVLVAWSALLAGAFSGTDASQRLLIALLLTSLTQYGLYALRHRA